MSGKREVLRFGLDDLTFLERPAQKANPLQPFREVVANGIEANAQRVDLFVKEDNWYCGDDGIGMAPNQLAYFGSTFGAGAKARTKAGRNQGIGLKMSAFQLQMGLRMFSRRQDSGEPFPLFEIGRDQSGRYGPISVDGKRAVPVSRPPAAGYSTIVHFKHPAPDPTQVVRYLNQRFLSLPCLVRVRVADGDDRQETWQPVSGLLACMEQTCEPIGKKEYSSCTLHWGIRRPQKSTSRTPEVLWEAPPLSIAHAGETIKHRGREHASLLSHYGISAGESEIILVVEAKGEDLYPDIERGGVRGWDENEAQQQIAADLPAELISYMRVYEAKHYDVAEENDLVLAMLGETSPGGGFRRPRVRGPVKNPHGPRRQGSEEGEKEERPPKFPGYVYVDDLGAIPVSFDFATNRVKINKNHPEIARYIDDPELTQLQRSQNRAIIATEVIKGWCRYVKEFGESPSQENLTMIVFASVSPWLLLKAGRRFNLFRQVKRRK